MKNILLILTTLLISTTIFAQAPDKMSYQTVIRNSSNALVTSQGVGIQISILQSSATGSAVYVERHFPNTNANGLASFEIGTGTVISGTFTGINWANGPYFIKTETDPNGGANYTISGTSELLSVPYALHAKTATSLVGGSSDWTLSGNNLYSTNSGNVGIGVANPTKKLHVSGDVNIGGLTVGRGNSGNNNCSAFGTNALAANTSNTNSAFGKDAMLVNTTGYDNVAFGVSAMIQNVSGQQNTAMGTRALENNVTGAGNTALGHIANVTGANFSNAIVIGNFASVDASNKARIGNNSLSSIGGQVSWTSFSDARIKDNVKDNVVGLAFIKALRPVTYNYNVDRQNELMGTPNTTTWDGKYDIEKIAFSGFLAQDVVAAAEETGYDFSGIDKSGETLLGLRYADFTVPLVKAMQEQQEIIEQQQQQINALLKEMELLKSQYQLSVNASKN